MNPKTFCLYSLLCAANAQTTSDHPSQKQKAVVSLLQTFAADIQPLPSKKGRPINSVTGTLLLATTAPDETSESDSGTWMMFMGGQLEGLEPNIQASNRSQCQNARCSVALHWGNCSAIRDRAYACGAMQDADNEKGNKYSTDENGIGTVQSFSVVPNYGIRWEGPISDHVLVGAYVQFFLFFIYVFRFLYHAIKSSRSSMRFDPIFVFLQSSPHTTGAKLVVEPCNQSLLLIMMMMLLL